MKIGNWKLEAYRLWSFSKENWTFKITPAISVGYMPGYYDFEIRWLFGECSVQLVNDVKLHNYFNRFTEVEELGAEEQNCCEGCCPGDCKGCGYKEIVTGKHPSQQFCTSAPNSSTSVNLLK